MWQPINDKSIILPSKSTPIIVSDGRNCSIMTTSKLLDQCDRAYCQWKWWMRIPEILK